tara:strand:+ start:14549 stop:15124 length:576 start_codon:yes stop_codon:yes gene_type:complete
MKKTNIILTILAILVWGLFFTLTAQEKDSISELSNGKFITHPQAGHIFIIDYPSKKQQEYNYVYPTIHLMEMYMDDIKDQKVHIGWRFISQEQDFGNGGLFYMSQCLYYPIALDYLYPYDYDHDYRGSISYGLDPNIPIENYGYILKEYGIMPFDRVEKIMEPKKPSFDDFYNWTIQYFKEQKETIKTNFQ